MADSRTTTKAGTASWGVTGSVTGVTGIVTSISTQEEAILAPEYNEVGAVVKQTLYDKHTTISATVEVAASMALPEEGAQITINGKTGYVKSAEVAEDNNAYRKISVTAELYANCTATSAV